MAHRDVQTSSTERTVEKYVYGTCLKQNVRVNKQVAV